MKVDALIVGGGITGLWLRAVLKDNGWSVVLIEADSLGGGQTIASQGIIHTGAKYAATGAPDQLIERLVKSSDQWSEHLAGSGIPDMHHVRVTTERLCYWNPTDPLPDDLLGWLEPVPARPRDVRAPPREELSGEMRNSREQVVDVASLINELAAGNPPDILRVRPDAVRWHRPHEETGVESVRLLDDDDRELVFEPRWVILAAGAGNASLQDELGLPGENMMQLRPLLMGMVRGVTSELNGHWYDAEGPRLTVTTHRDQQDRRVWVLGGRLSELSAFESDQEFLADARRELQAALPGVTLEGTEWSCYRAVRAEPATAAGQIPDGPRVLFDANVVTIWPVKLTLVTEVARQLIGHLREIDELSSSTSMPDLPDDWPRPPIARPPWETVARWYPFAISTGG